jgi:hypothetical protein
MLYFDPFNPYTGYMTQLRINEVETLASQFAATTRNDRAVRVSLKDAYRAHLKADGAELFVVDPYCGHALPLRVVDFEWRGITAYWVTGGGAHLAVKRFDVVGAK